MVVNRCCDTGVNGAEIGNKSADRNRRLPNRTYWAAWRNKVASNLTEGIEKPLTGFDEQGEVIPDYRRSRVARAISA